MLQQLQKLIGECREGKKYETGELIGIHETEWTLLMILKLPDGCFKLILICMQCNIKVV